MSRPQFGLVTPYGRMDIDEYWLRHAEGAKQLFEPMLTAR